MNGISLPFFAFVCAKDIPTSVCVCVCVCVRVCVCFWGVLHNCQLLPQWHRVQSMDFSTFGTDNGAAQKPESLDM